MDDLSIILPVYNERDTIETVLINWTKELEDLNISYHFIICEDGSGDGTKELLEKIKNKYKIILNQKMERRGYGGAVIDGITGAQSHFILCIDSDGQCDEKDFKKIWDYRDHNIDVLIGWRTSRADPWYRKLYSKMFGTVFKILFPTPIHDPSAPYVLFKKNTILPHIKYLTFLKEGFWWGFVGMCVKKNLSIYDIPVKHLNRLNGETQVYTFDKIFDIAVRNLIGLVKLRLAE